jgi:hypothetical protein
MYLAYLDESGDSGLINSPTNYFVLSCILVNETNWLNSLDLLVELRRYLKIKYNIPTRPELKARYLKTGHGPLAHLQLSFASRMEIYRELMQYQAQGLNIKTFSIAIEKQGAHARGWEPRYAAWTFAIQRINRFCGNSEWAMLFPDEGHGYFIRLRLRHMRRYHLVPAHFGPGNIPFPVHRIIEDPNERKSQDSYFIQLADWNAYATLRSSYVEPTARVPVDLWDELGQILLLEVNTLRGGPPGIVRYP